MTRPFVSVLIDTYNHERFIEQAIVSVFEQDFPAADREIIVVDDGSTDGTPDIVRKFGPRVRLFRKPNGGQASAFNAGIPECHGEIVSFLDGDDWWAPGKLRRVSNLFAADPPLGFVGHSIVESYGTGAERLIALHSEQRFRLKGYGVRSGRAADGDHYYRVTIAMPTRLTEQGRELAGKLAALYESDPRAALPRGI